MWFRACLKFMETVTFTNVFLGQQRISPLQKTNSGAFSYLEHSRHNIY